MESMPQLQKEVASVAAAKPFKCCFRPDIKFERDLRKQGDAGTRKKVEAVINDLSNELQIQRTIEDAARKAARLGYPVKGKANTFALFVGDKWRIFFTLERESEASLILTFNEFGDHKELGLSH